MAATQVAPRACVARRAPSVAATDAAVKAGVKHIVFMSAVGTRQEEEPARGASCWRGEQRLAVTVPAWTILRMNFHAEAFLLALAAGAQALRGVLAEGLQRRVEAIDESKTGITIGLTPPTPKGRPTIVIPQGGLRPSKHAHRATSRHRRVSRPRPYGNHPSLRPGRVDDISEKPIDII